MGIPIVLTWFAVALLGLASFARLIWKQGLPGAALGLPGLIGVVASFGFVSAAIGVMEQVWTFAWGGFWVAAAIGLLGVSGVFFSAYRAWLLPNTAAH